jgi:hypothetical protein
MLRWLHYFWRVVRQNIIAREYVEEEAAHFVGGSQAERERDREKG